MSNSEIPKSSDRRSFIGAIEVLGAAGFALPQRQDLGGTRPEIIFRSGME
jgi:hypothetical protein